ncbi:DUF7093 family protein [Natrinema sp. LN54]|uniref:DUF7093 family protein n=1 Tax=Natrinema sp. LN54 TaxID=3458705 RepID=UPI0040373ADF
MVLRCSLLGHDFGESEVEREREERGSEVVVTVQEYEECVRCGERSVISENTEVTSLTAGTDAGDSLPDEPETEPPESTADTDAAPAGETDADAGFIDADADDGIDLSDGDDAEFIDADDTASDADETDAPRPEPSPDAADADMPAADADTDADEDADDIDLPTDENGDPVTDDGEILEDDEASPDRDRDRDHGEWPDSSDVGPPVGAESTPADWPDDAADTDSEAEPAGGAADPDPAEIDDDAVVLDDDGPTSTVGASGDGAAAATTDARSVTAEPPTDDRSDADPAADADSGTGIERATSAPTPAESGGAPADDVPTEFYCPRCDYVAAGDRGSLRTGDICPDCRKGYLSERERQR